MMRFEIEIESYFGDGKLTVESDDFEVFSALRDFVEMQNMHGWDVSYMLVTLDEEEAEEIEDEEAFADEKSDEQTDS